MGRPVRDLTGNVFDRLTVIKQQGNGRSQEVLWLCQCVCGNTSVVTRSNLQFGGTRSCGCLFSEKASERYTEIGHANRRHGASTRDNGPTVEYRAWASMKRRCTNPNVWNYKNYGGRGIKVCRRWTESFEAFLADVGIKPDPAFVLDRLNNDGDYEPTNVRWVSLSESNKNRRPSKRSR